jgi:thioredoxin reductase/NAD-dependent dihydropyrimidine dehydrogenase PreA subunit
VTAETPVPRRAKAFRADSDLERGRGILVGSLLGALVLVVALVLESGPRALVSPGPLARPHAALACAACHAGGSSTASCGGCHGRHASVRVAHDELARHGELSCASCHSLHGRERALAFEANGDVALVDGDHERTLVRGAPHAARPPVAVSSPGPTFATLVPLVPASACARCHALESARDRAAACVAREAAVSLCFDEHRRPGTRGAGATPERDAVVERARSLLRDPAVSAEIAARPQVVRSAGFILVALGVAALFVVERRRRAASVGGVPSGAAGPLRAGSSSRSHARLPVIDAGRCLGCHACVDACPYGALAIQRYVAVLERPAACCGAGPCEDSCPNGSLRLAASSEPSRGPRLSDVLEVPERPGLFLAGDVTGGTLIRNAVRQGTSVARLVASRLEVARQAGEKRTCGTIDLLVVGAGPAGLAAGLVATELGLRVSVLEQAGVAASIRRFSRQKLVLDAATATDERAPLWLADATKEELLARWQHAIRKAGLEVHENTRVSEIVRSRETTDFVVHAEVAGGKRSQLSARYVLLAVGTRGSPRPLDAAVPEVASPRVHYELSDARAFAGKRCVIVGLGDVAMESALALAAQQDAEVTVVYRGSGFARGSRRNIDAVARLAAKGRIRLLFDAELREVRAASLEIEVSGRACSLEYDALFVHVGMIPAHALLVSAGVPSL